MRNRNMIKTVTVGVSGGVMLTLLSLIRVEHFPWPDFVHSKYGFPLLWLTHQTSSIAGSVDRWFLDYTGFLVDLLFWILLTLSFLAVYRRRSRPKGTQKQG